MSLDIMLKGNGLHVFLYASRNLPLVAPRIDVLQVRRNRSDKVIDLFLAGFILFCDLVRDRSLKLANAAGNIVSIEKLKADFWSHVPL